MKRYSSDWYWYYVINYTLVIIIVFPIYWTLISSFKKPNELITSEPTFYPREITLQYYDQIWNFDRQKRLQDTEAEDIDSYLPDGDGIKNHVESEKSDRMWRADPSDGLRPLKSMRNKLSKKL